jgi:DNA-binding IclR family transcriptional regulator
VKVTSTDPQGSIMIDLTAERFESLAPITTDALRQHARKLGCPYAAVRKGLDALEAARLIERCGDSYRIKPGGAAR